MEAPVIALLIVGGMFVLGLLTSRNKDSSRESWKRAKQKRLMSRLAIVLVLLAAASLVGALAQFRVARVEKAPIVVLVIDASMSMDRTDYAPTRLVAAQEAARAFLRTLPDTFRAGLVTYAIEPALLAQPTADRAEVLAKLADPPRGNRTVIGEGLDTTLNSIEVEWDEDGRADTAVILLSDGHNTRRDSVDPIEAARRARALEVPIHTLLIGDPEELAGENLELMTGIAEVSGGSATTAETTEELTGVYEDLGTRLATELEVGGSAQQFVVVASLFAGAAVFLALRYVF